MAELNKRQYKDLDKKIEKIKEWMDEENSSLSDRNILNNFSFLTELAQRLEQMLENSNVQINKMQAGMQENYQVVNEFLEKHEQTENWEKFLEQKRADAEEKHRQDTDPNYKEEQKLKELKEEADAETEDSDD